MEATASQLAEKQMCSLVEQLRPPTAVRDAARRVVNEVVKTLQQAAATSSKFILARQCVCGSFGKGAVCT